MTQNEQPFRKRPNLNPQSVLLEKKPFVPITSRWQRDIDGRSWKRKTRAFRTNFRSGNRKKNQYK